jgi:hypothetical protein
VIKGRRRSDVAAVTLLEHGEKKHQEQLRAACAANGGKLALSNLCINLKPILDELTARYRLPRRFH